MKGSFVFTIVMDIDPRVPRSDLTCPARGLLVKGLIKKKSALEDGYAQYETHYAGVSDPQKCMQYADKMLLWWNTTGHLVNDHNSVDYGTFSTQEKSWYWLMKGVSNQLSGSSMNRKLDKIYWSWYYDRYDSPLQKSCAINFTCSGSTGEADNVLSGMSDDRGTQWTMCTVPTFNNYCIKNAITLTKAKECTGLTQDGGFGIDCKNWYDNSLNDDERETLVNNICNWYPWLSECMCLNRREDEKYMKMLDLLPTGLSDGCWYQPCKKEGNDRLVGPVMRDERHKCRIEYCGNLIQGVGGGGFTLDDIQQITDCSINSEGGGGGTNQTNPPVVGGGGGSESSDSSWTSKNTILIVVGSVFLLIIIISVIVALRMSTSSSSATPKPKVKSKG